MRADRENNHAAISTAGDFDRIVFTLDQRRQAVTAAAFEAVCEKAWSVWRGLHAAGAEAHADVWLVLTSRLDHARERMALASLGEEHLAVLRDLRAELHEQAALLPAVPEMSGEDVA